MASAEARYRVRVPSIILEKEGEDSPMFTIDENGITWHGLTYAAAVALQEALMKGPIDLGKAQVALLEGRA